MKIVADMKSDIEQKMKLEWLCKVASDYESRASVWNLVIATATFKNLSI